MSNYYGIGLGGPITAGKPPLAPSPGGRPQPLTPAQLKATQRAQMTPQQRKHAEAQDKIQAENAAAKQRIASKETEADPFTIPGQEDTRTLFQKVQKRAPNAAEQAELKKYVSHAKEIVTGGAGGPPGFTKNLSDEEKQKLFIGTVSRLQFYLDHLKEPRGKEVDEINAQTAETMEANAYAKQFVMSGQGVEGEPHKGDGRGWNWTNFDTLNHFRTIQQREPTQAEEKILIKFVKLADDARARGGAGDSNAQKEFDLLHRKANYFARHLEEPRHADLEKLRREADEIVSRHVAEYYAHKPKGLMGEIIDWGHTASKGFNAFKQLPGIKQLSAVNDFIIHGAAEYYKQMGAAAGQVPFVGSGISAGFGIFGGDELAAMDAINRGANVSDAAMSGLKQALADAATVSDYITAITAFVPGFGQIAAGISGAIAGASALASGKSITDALMAAAEDAVMSMIPAGKFAGLAKKVAQGAFQMARVMVAGGSMEAGAEAALIKNLPGGPTAQKAVTEALAVAKAAASGKPFDKIALDELRAHLPPAAQKALDVGRAAAAGKPLDKATLDEIRSHLPPNAQQAFDVMRDAASGKPLDKIALDRLRAQLPPEVLQAFDTGLSFAQGKKVQAIIAENMKSLNIGPDQIGKLADQGSHLVKLSKPFQAAAEDLKGSALKGFNFATGVLARSGVLPDTLIAMRTKLGPEGRRGFDRALAAHGAVAGSIKKAVAGATPPSAPLTQQQIDLQKLAQLTPAQQKQLVDYANLQQLAKLTPAQQKQLVEYAKAQQDLKKLAQLTPTQQKQLIEYAKAQQDLQKLAQLTPADQQRLVEYAKSIAPKPVESVSHPAAQQLAAKGAAILPQQHPTVQKTVASLKTKAAQDGAKLAIGAIVSKMPTTTAADLRTKLNPEAKHGFDQAVAAHTASAPPAKPTEPAVPSTYPPYPPHLTGALSAPPPHPHPHPHPHPGGHPGRYPGVFRGGRAVPGWWNSWDAPQVITTTETCHTWGDPIEIPTSMQTSAKVALGASGGRPTTMRGENGVLYLFSYEGGGISARPCAAVGVLGACFDVNGTTWGPATTDMSRDMRWAGMSAVNGSKGHPRPVLGPDGADYLFAMENGTLTVRRAVQ